MTMLLTPLLLGLLYTLFVVPIKRKGILEYLLLLSSLASLFTLNLTTYTSVLSSFFILQALIFIRTNKSNTGVKSLVFGMLISLANIEMIQPYYQAYIISLVLIYLILSSRELHNALLYKSMILVIASLALKFNNTANYELIFNISLIATALILIKLILTKEATALNIFPIFLIYTIALDTNYILPVFTYMLIYSSIYNNSKYDLVNIAMLIVPFIDSNIFSSISSHFLHTSNSPIETTYLSWIFIILTTISSIKIISTMINKNKIKFSYSTAILILTILVIASPLEWTKTNFFLQQPIPLLLIIPLILAQTIWLRWTEKLSMPKIVFNTQKIRVLTNKINNFFSNTNLKILNKAFLYVCKKINQVFENSNYTTLYIISILVILLVLLIHGGLV